MLSALDSSGAYAALNYFFAALAIVAFGVEAWAFADAIGRPTQAFPAAGKQTKPIWLIITGVAAVLGLYMAIYGLGVSLLLAVIAFVAAAIYLADVRPKVKEYRRGSNSGPYGPW